MTADGAHDAIRSGLTCNVGFAGTDLPSPVTNRQPHVIETVETSIDRGVNRWRVEKIDPRREVRKMLEWSNVKLTLPPRCR